MAYQLLNHAREQMELREVALDVVDAIFYNPEQIVEGYNGRKIYQSRVTLAVGGMSPRLFLVRLVVNPNEDPAVIITVIATTQIDRYWSAS